MPRDSWTHYGLVIDSIAVGLQRDYLDSSLAASVLGFDRLLGTHDHYQLRV